MHRRQPRNPRARWDTYDVHARRARRAQRLILQLAEERREAQADADRAAHHACYRTWRRAIQTARVANMRIAQILFDM